MAPQSDNLNQLWLDNRFPFNMVAYARDHGGNYWGYGILGATAGILGKSKRGWAGLGGRVGSDYGTTGPKFPSSPHTS